MHQPSIAVVIPAFNSATTISGALDSALNQAEPPEEIIVVDDGSTDATKEVVRGFGSAVRLITQPNQGAAVARQTGTEAATTDYIAYLDADDWWPSDKLSLCRFILTREEIYFLLADLQRARPGGLPVTYLPRNITFFPWARQYLDEYRVSGNIADLYRLPSELGLFLLLRGFPVFPSTALIKREVVLGVGGWDARFRRCQDFDLGLRIARRFPLHYLDQVQAILGLHEVNSDASAYVIKQTQGDIRVLKAHFAAEPPESLYRQQVAQALARKCCNLGYFYRKTGEMAQARQAYRHALQWPSRRFHAFLRWALLLLRAFDK
ncbi:MAG TPA: glycosyltransferase [Candidatus Competibacter sp.]|nr:glycosyltransferase [Candidatus Competibacter sp.]